MEISMEINSRWNIYFVFVLASHCDEFKGKKNGESNEKRKIETNTKWKAWIDKWIFRTSNTSILGGNKNSKLCAWQFVSNNPKTKHPNLEKSDELKWIWIKYQKH